MTVSTRAGTFLVLRSRELRCGFLNKGWNCRMGTRGAMHVWRNVEARLSNHGCRGKAVSITVCVCESVCVWVCVWVWVWVCVCVRVCVWVCGCEWVCGCTRAVRACSCTYPACNTHHHIICGFWFHHIFRHYFIHGTIFGKYLLNIKGVFLFSLQLRSKIGSTCPDDCPTFLLVRSLKTIRCSW